MSDIDALAEGLETLFLRDAVAFASKDESGNVTVLRDPENIATMLAATPPVAALLADAAIGRVAKALHQRCTPSSCWPILDQFGHDQACHIKAEADATALGGET